MDLGHVAEAQIRALMARGGTVESITAALRAGGVSAASPATISRRMAEMRGEARGARLAQRQGTMAQPAEPSPPRELPTRPEEIPEGASLTELAELRNRCKAALSQAEDEADLKLVGQLIRVQASLEDLIRKASPPRVEDPNEHPDMVKLGAEVAARLHKMVDMVCGE